jgi:hypothetical protein
MTRILSELLGAREPAFQQGLQRLERASGGASEDIRLTTEILHGMQDRLKQLGLDPHDTTGRELYAALMQRVKEDNAIFQNLIGVDVEHDSRQVTTVVERFINSLDIPKEVFALRAAAAKRLLRKHAPKRAMKRLGYRSLESMLKHEPCSLIFTAAHLVETAAWHKQITAAYKRLSPSDFECRDLHILAPVNARWENLAKEYVSHAKQNIVGLRELGTVVLLPLPTLRMEAAPLAVTLLTLQTANEIASASAYLKMHQVRPDFGSVVADIARSEPFTKAEIGGSLLPWKVVQRYFARHPEAYNPDIFEPHVQREDLRWHAAEDILGAMHPRFEFWKNSGHLGLLAKGETVSLNIMDSVLNFCNTLPYEKRMVRYARSHMWHELLLRYMRQGNIERTMHEQLTDELIDNPSISA